MASGMIGLEIHVYLTTDEKLFCSCHATREKGTTPNTFVCPLCTGQPGAKPQLPNKDAVKKAVQVALMLGCTISRRMHWMRKHYDWPDLPKGYQTTLSGAHAKPVGERGEFAGIRINSMHLEEDPASWNPKTGVIDYNRSGLPLIEIVTEPDFTYADEVVAWLKKLLHLLHYLKAVDRNAGIKADVNVNIPGKTERVEVKNVNSLAGVKQTIEFELERQLREGSVRETRRYDEAKGKTMRMRGKEDASDYRFIADPDLAPIEIAGSLIHELEQALPESPDAKLQKLITKYKIGEADAAVLAKDLDIADFFEEVAKHIDGTFALSWVTVELLRVLNYNKKELAEVDIAVDHFVKLVELVKNGTITELQAKQVLNGFVPKSSDPTENVKAKMDDASELQNHIDNALAANKQAVTDYKAGDAKALNFLIGAVMQSTNRRADYKVVKQLFEKALA